MKPPTTAHKHWSDKTIEGDPRIDTGYLFDEDNTLYLATEANHPLFMPLGVAPMPRNRWEWFLFDIHSGSLMKFGKLNVLAYAISAFKINNIGRREASARAKELA